MTVVISNPLAQNLEGVAFTGTRAGVQQHFIVPREALEDVEYNMFETPEAMLQAFGRQQDLVAQMAAKALDAGQGGSAAVVLQSLL